MDVIFLEKEIKVQINTNNRQISQHIYMSMDERITELNNNMIIVGGSGAGKTFRFARPILRQMTGSYICTDPKGELARKEGNYLEERGYDVQVINLLNASGMRKSAHFNPFFYIKDDVDIQRLATNIMENTKPRDAQNKDAFFDGAAGDLLVALLTYTFETYKNNKKKMNFRTVMELLRKADFEIDPETYAKKESELDKLFSELERKENIRILNEKRQGIFTKSMSNAVIKYNATMRGAADTVRSIIITLDQRLSRLHNDALLDLLSDDDININEFGTGKNYDGKTKKAVFLVTPDSDTSYNFIVGMFYTITIQKSYEIADTLYNGHLPLSITFLMDEFANVALPEDFDKVLSTMRSRNMNSIIIIQSMAQIKALYEKRWETITGNCDTFIYLGGNEQSTHKYVSEMLDKGTFDKRTTGETTGQYGNSSKNYDVVGRELLTPGEVRKLSKRKCIVLIRGFDPCIDDKIRTNENPLFKYKCFKENFVYDRRRHIKGNMYFAQKSYADTIKREEEINETSGKIIEINAETLMELSSEAIESYSESGWYEELSEDMLATEAEKMEEKLKEVPVSDEELMNLTKEEMENFLILRSEGYSDRQIKVLIKIIASGKDIDDVKKMFPDSMSAERIELLAEKFI